MRDDERCARCGEVYRVAEFRTHPEPNAKGRRHLRLWRFVGFLLGFHPFERTADAVRIRIARDDA